MLVASRGTGAMKNQFVFGVWCYVSRGESIPFAVVLQCAVM